MILRMTYVEAVVAVRSTYLLARMVQREYEVFPPTPPLGTNFEGGGIRESTVKQRYEVFPNPTSGRVTLTYPVGSNQRVPEYAYLIDLNGKVLKPFVLTGNGREVLQLPDGAGGVLLLEVTRDRETLHRQRIVLIH